VGTGIGSGTGEGKMQPPVPEVLLLPPPKPPKELRGQTLVVRVSIDATGEVRDVEFRSTGDRGYDSRLRKVARDWRFRPARDPSGKPIPVQFDVTLGF
jgi:TonB family protein